MTEVTSNAPVKKFVEHEFSGTHFHLLIVADDQQIHAAQAKRGQTTPKDICVFVDLSPVQDTHGRARGIAVDKHLAACAKQHPNAKLVVTVPVPAAFAKAMLSGDHTTFGRGTMQNIIDGLLGYRTLALLDSIAVFVNGGQTYWARPARPTWAELEHPKAEAKPKPAAPKQPTKPAKLNDKLPQKATPAKTNALASSDQKIAEKLSKDSPWHANSNKRWHAFGLNTGPVDDRNQQVAFDSLMARLGLERIVKDVSDDEIIETARLITSLEGGAAPHEISNKQTLGRLLGAVLHALGNERYAEQLNDLHFSLKIEQEKGNDIRKQILMVARTGALKFRQGNATRPLLDQVFEGLHRRVRGALRRRKGNAAAKTAPVAPVVEAPAKKNKKRKKKVKQASTEQPFESRFAAKILDTDQPALSEEEYQARKQQLQEAQK